jgi:hypothetical protein
MRRLLALSVAFGLCGCSSALSDYMVPGYTPHVEPVVEQSSTVQPAYAPPRPPPPPIDGADDLRALKKLRDDGVLTEQEYQTKKADILNRM